MVTVNLIPEAMRMSLRRRQHIQRWSLAVAVILGMLAFALGADWLNRTEAGELQAKSKEMTLRIDALRTHLSEVTALADQASLQLRRAEALRAKRPWSGMLELVDSSMPESCWLISLSTDPAQPSATSNGRNSARAARNKVKEIEPVSIETPRKLKLVGFASEPAQPYEFVIRLQKTGAFETVHLVRARRQPLLGGDYFQFEIVCEW